MNPLWDRQSLYSRKHIAAMASEPSLFGYCNAGSSGRGIRRAECDDLYDNHATSGMPRLKNFNLMRFLIVTWSAACGIAS